MNYPPKIQQMKEKDPQNESLSHVTYVTDHELPRW